MDREYPEGYGKSFRSTGWVYHYLFDKPLAGLLSMDAQEVKVVADGLGSIGSTHLTLLQGKMAVLFHMLVSSAANQDDLVMVHSMLYDTIAPKILMSKKAVVSALVRFLPDAAMELRRLRHIKDLNGKQCVFLPFVGYRLPQLDDDPDLLARIVEGSGVIEALVPLLTKATLDANHHAARSVKSFTLSLLSLLPMTSSTERARILDAVLSDPCLVYNPASSQSPWYVFVHRVLLIRLGFGNDFANGYNGLEWDRFIYVVERFTIDRAMEVTREIIAFYLRIGHPAPRGLMDDFVPWLLKSGVGAQAILVNIPGLFDLPGPVIAPLALVQDLKVLARTSPDLADECATAMVKTVLNSALPGDYWYLRGCHTDIVRIIVDDPLARRKLVERETIHPTVFQEMVRLVSSNPKLFRADELRAVLRWNLTVDAETFQHVLNEAIRIARSLMDTNPLSNIPIAEREALFVPFLHRTIAGTLYGIGWNNVRNSLIGCWKDPFAVVAKRTLVALAGKTETARLLSSSSKIFAYLSTKKRKKTLLEFTLLAAVQRQRAELVDERSAFRWMSLALCTDRPEESVAAMFSKAKEMRIDVEEEELVAGLFQAAMYECPRELDVKWLALMEEILARPKRFSSETNESLAQFLESRLTNGSLPFPVLVRCAVAIKWSPKVVVPWNCDNEVASNLELNFHTNAVLFVQSILALCSACQLPRLRGGGTHLPLDLVRRLFEFYVRKS